MNSQRPELFKNPRQMLNNLAEAVTNDTLNEGATYASEQGMDVVRMPKYLQVTEERMSKAGIIDLKPYFAQSSKRRYNKKGRWYVFVPIQIKTRDMPRKAYDELRAVAIGDTVGASTTGYTQYLYDRRKQSTSAPSLNYTPKSNKVNITNKAWGSGSRREYMAFRTISQDSPPSSWIINRGKTDTGELSKTLVKNIERLMKWKLNN